MCPPPLPAPGNGRSADNPLTAGPPDTRSAIRYSVIVPAYNAEATLGACLRALLDQTLAPAAYEVIVVDDGSTDTTARVAARFPVSVLRQAHAGPAAARNQGARAARGEILAFTDADCEPVPAWLGRIVEPIERHADIGG